jgi:hypothetical protein
MRAVPSWECSVNTRSISLQKLFRRELCKLTPYNNVFSD